MNKLKNKNQKENKWSLVDDHDHNEKCETKQSLGNKKITINSKIQKKKEKKG